MNWLPETAEAEAAPDDVVVVAGDLLVSTGLAETEAELLLPGAFGDDEGEDVATAGRVGGSVGSPAFLKHERYEALVALVRVLL